MSTKTIITLICGHNYLHEGIPSESERRSEQNPDPAVQCRTCGTRQLVVNTQVNASR